MDSNALDKATWFSTIRPNTNFNVIRTLLVPSDGMLSYLVAQLPAALREGCHSLVIHPSDPATLGDVVLADCFGHAERHLNKNV